MYGYHSYVSGQHVPQPVDHPHGQYHSYVPGYGHPVPPPVEEQPGLKGGSLLYWVRCYIHGVNIL